ncbi:MAG: hypothetical protein NTV55_02595 [Planctomycetota bacterium]|nr:hypothetical protein [Planctomycetota bacterium]
MRWFAHSGLLAIFLGLASSSGAAPDLKDTRLVSQPAVSARHMAFVYAEDLWIANLDGSKVAHPGG